MRKSGICLAVMMILAAGGMRAEETTEGMRLDYGADLRLRQIHFDNIPIIADPPGVTRSGENHFFRVRPRFWTSLTLNETVRLYGRLVNEFRYFYTPDNDTMDFPDELVVDALYADITGLMDGVIDIRIGRQDLIYGTGKLLLEGTPKDGSRTIYSDAVRVRYTGLTGMTIDVLGIYNEAENQLAVGNKDRDLTGFDPAFNDLVESGGGIYAMCRSNPDFGFDLYYLLKDESRWFDREGERRPGRETHTVGTRLLPKIDESLNVGVELAYQFGETDDDRDIEAYMIDAAMTYRLGGESSKTVVGVGYYHISGDKPDTDKVEGWNPLWARWPQYSELYVYAFDAEAAGYWSNVSMPNVTCTMQHSATWKTAALLGYMMAPEATGPGGGDVRGWLATVRTDFTVATSVFSENDSILGHFVVEVFDPQDYYNVSDMAHFARWEMTYAF